MGKKKKPIGVKRKRGKKFVWTDPTAKAEVMDKSANSYDSRNNTNQFDDFRFKNEDFSPMPVLKRPRNHKFALDDETTVYDEHADELQISDDSGDEGASSGPYKKRKVTNLAPVENKRQAFKEMILKSKAAKYERQETREKADVEIEKMNKEFKDLTPLLGVHGQVKVDRPPVDEFENLIGQIRHENDTMRPNVSAMPKVMSDDPSELPKQLILASSLLSDSAKSSIVKGNPEVQVGFEISQLFIQTDISATDLGKIAWAVSQLLPKVYFPEIILFLNEKCPQIDII